MIRSFQKFDRIDVQYRRPASQTFRGEKTGDPSSGAETGQSKNFCLVTHCNYLQLKPNFPINTSFHLP